VTAAIGWIYIVATVIKETINIDPYDFIPVSIHTRALQISSMTVKFDVALPATGLANEIWIPICEVSKSGSNTAVDEQIITYNPILSLEIAEAL
jgi:hypothetical protein